MTMLQYSPDLWPLFDHTNPRSAPPQFRGAVAPPRDEALKSIEHIDVNDPRFATALNTLGESTIAAARAAPDRPHASALLASTADIAETCVIRTTAPSTRSMCLKWRALCVAAHSDLQPLRTRARLAPTVAAAVLESAAANPADADAQHLAGTVAHKLATLSPLEARLVAAMAAAPLPTVTPLDAWWHAETASGLRRSWLRNNNLLYRTRTNAPAAAAAEEPAGGAGADGRVGTARSRWPRRGTAADTAATAAAAGWVRAAVGSCLHVWPCTDADVEQSEECRRAVGHTLSSPYQRAQPRAVSGFDDDVASSLRVSYVLAKRTTRLNMGDAAAAPSHAADPPR